MNGVLFLHLKGADEIARIFGVSRDTVVQWAKKGAPIVIVGKKYQTRYEDLWSWLLKSYTISFCSHGAKIDDAGLEVCSCGNVAGTEYISSKKKHKVRCFRCGASTAPHKTLEKAVHEWNEGVL